MARIPGISPDQIEDQVVATWARETTDEAIGVYGHSPVAYRKLMHFVEEAKYRGSVPFPLKELVRLKIAEFNQCERCQHYREPSARAATLYSGELYEEYVLPRLEGAVDLTPRERRALEFTEAFAVAHTAIDQAFIERMKEEFSNEELVELALAVAAFLALGRLNAVFGIMPKPEDESAFFLNEAPI